MDFNPAFKDYLKEAVGETKSLAALDALCEPASVSVRLNPQKIPAGQDADTILGISGTESVPWNHYGVFLPERPVFTLDPLMHGGVYYVQDSSAMFPGHVFRQALHKILEDNPSRHIHALDLCAAPGGKTTDMASSLRGLLGGDFILVSNEIMKQRAAVLADTVGIWGDPSVVVTSADPVAFARLEGFFDIVVADVPCSGEGMFRKDEEAVAQWSAENVAMCQARQRRIIADVWPSLSVGGMLVYSTCTFNKLENDDNVAWIAATLGAEIVKPDFDSDGLIDTQYGVSLVPGFVRGEGQYCALLRKTGKGGDSSGDTQDRVFGAVASPVSFKSRKKDGGTGWQKVPAEMSGRLKALFNTDVQLLMKGEMIVALPEELVCALPMLEYLHPMMRGTAVGQIKGRDLVPDADLALSIILSDSAFPKVEVSLDMARAFLHRDAIRLENAWRGLVLLCYKGHPLGFVKNLGNRCNNLHPQSRRIRMDI